MKGGIISGNRAIVGGGIYASESDLFLSGGEISGNTALKGAGVSFFLRGNADYSFNVGKNTVITGNTDTNGNTSNLYWEDISKRTTITILDGGNAPGGMEIGISSRETPTASEPGRISDTIMQKAYAGYFFSDNDNY